MSTFSATPFARPSSRRRAPAVPATIDTATLFELLSDGTRRRILTLLLDHDEICVCRMVGALAQAQPKISRHLGVMREAGLLVSRRHATWILYRFDPRLPAWAMRAITMMAEGARLEPAYEHDSARLDHLKRCDDVEYQ